MLPAKLATALAAVLIIAASVAVVVADSPPKQFTGCLGKDGTILRVAIGTSPTKVCGPNETQITWNSQGPKGEPGAGGGASVVTYEWPPDFLEYACGPGWIAVGRLPEPTDCGTATPTFEPLTGINGFAAFPLDPADYPAGAKVALRFYAFQSDPGTTACLGLFDASSLEPIETSRTCLTAPGWSTTVPVALGTSPRQIAIEVEQPNAVLNEFGEWRSPFGFGQAFLEVTW